MRRTPCQGGVRRHESPMGVSQRAHMSIAHNVDHEKTVEVAGRRPGPPRRARDRRAVCLHPLHRGSRSRQALAARVTRKNVNFLSGSSTAPSSSSPTSSAVDGTYHVSAGSEAGYRVAEVLVGQHATAVGRTSKIWGSITIADDQVTAGTFTVDMASVVSDQSQRNAEFDGRIMDVAKYPTATLTLTAPVALGTAPAVGAEATYHASGTLDMHGVSQEVSFSLTTERTADGIYASGRPPDRVRTVEHCQSEPGRLRHHRRLGHARSSRVPDNRARESRRLGVRFVVHHQWRRWGAGHRSEYDRSEDHHPQRVRGGWAGRLLSPGIGFQVSGRPSSGSG